jgi:hypothetical protein
MLMTELVINFSEPREMALILAKLRELRGLHRITVCAHRKRRSDRQNRYYWPCFVQPFAEFLNGQGEAVTDLEAHEILKTRFNSKTITDKRTGEAMDFPTTTTTLTTVEFNQYLDKCAVFLLDFAGIVVPEPSIYREVE